jgi:hypothetical protein
MHVGAAYLRSHGAQKSGAGREIRAIEFADFDRLPWREHHGGEDAVTHVCYDTVGGSDKRQATGG